MNLEMAVKENTCIPSSFSTAAFRVDGESEESLRRKPVELNMLAAKQRESIQTGFIHLCYESLLGEFHGTIPILENFCFVLALLRTRTAEHILKGKGLLEKLLAFEVAGNFPIYLHEYPRCRDRVFGLQILPAIHWILTDFYVVLGPDLKCALHTLLQRIVSRARLEDKERPLSFSAQCKFQAFTHPEQPLPPPVSAKDCGDFLIGAQLTGCLRDALPIVLEKWDRNLGVFLGQQAQEGIEPQVTLLDLFMGHYFGHYSQRALKNHPIHLQAALIQPFLERPNVPMPAGGLRVLCQNPYTLIWGNGREVNSLAANRLAANSCAANCLVTQTGHVEGGLVFVLPPLLPDEENGKMEVALFCNLHPGHTLWINGKKATAFGLGDLVEIRSLTHRIQLCFRQIAGHGVFTGHISQGNRPSQTRCTGPLRDEAFDWKIGLRTVFRKEACTIQVSVAY